MYKFIIATFTMLCSFFITAKGQEVDTSFKAIATQLMERDYQAGSMQKKRRVIPSVGKQTIAPSTNKATPVYQSVLKSQTSPTYRKALGTSKKTLNGLCKDTSYTRLLSVYRGQIYVESIDELVSGGMLISATMVDTARLPVPSWRTFMLLLKVNDDGDIQWLKQYEDVNPGDISTFFMGDVFELASGEILCTGYWNNSANSNIYNTVIYRLTSTGDIIWTKAFKSMLSTFNWPEGTFNFAITGAVIGNDGDIFICGTSHPYGAGIGRATVLRLNSSGDLVWDANYGQDDTYNAVGANIFFENGQIILSTIIRTGGTDIPPAVTFLTLGYDDGKILNKRFFTIDYTEFWERFAKSFTYWDSKCVRLKNGHYLVYGKLFSDFGVDQFPGHYFGVIEFNASFNIVDAYTIYSDVKSNYYNSRLRFDETGRGFLFILKYIDLWNADEYIGSFYNQQFRHQRKVAYRQIGITESNSAALLRSGAYVSVQGLFKDGFNTSFFEWRKMHDSDTSSECLGRDTLLFRFSPLKMKEYPNYFFSDLVVRGMVASVVPSITQYDNLQHFAEDGCKQTNYCNTVKIHGNPLVCGASREAGFTASKNAACGAIVQWQIDPAIIDSMRTTTDTSAIIWFKNVNWNGKLYALSSAGACYGTVIDSMEVHLVKSQGAISLGVDTALCTGNSITLNAGTGYHNYEWQDHSIDSVFTVTQPGTYFVTATNFCGVSYADTILVSLAPPVPFNVGSDITLCSNQPATIVAPSGFLNYSWSSDQSANTIKGRSVTISPLVNSTYFVAAEKTRGCFAYDTIQVVVRQVPVIYLGNDTSFCEGGNVVLTVGEGFEQVEWSTGKIGEQIEVNKAGTYTVTGITVDGCKAFDTLSVAAVWPKPLVELGNDSGICAEGSRTLNAGNHASYLWQNGSTAANYTLTAPGQYYVQVTNAQLCTASDTININTVLPQPSGFLTPFDSLCAYEPLWLSPNNSYKTYMWNTGATSSTINITSIGTYTLSVTDNKGCIGNDTTAVVTKECLKGFHIPTAFTPNNDKLNDLLKPVIGAILKEYLFTVYNRWGQIVFTSKNIHEAWDGTYKGLPQNPGIFMWTCSWQVEGGATHFEKGVVSLIR